MRHPESLEYQATVVNSGAYRFPEAPIAQEDQKYTGRNLA